MTLQVGLLGAGRIGQTHARAIENMESATVAAVFDPVEEACTDIIERHGAVRKSIDDILADAAIDAVLVCTPTNQHAEQIEQAARAGKAVFCEKPIDLDADRVRACLEVVQSCKASLMVGFNRRFDTQFSTLKRRLAAGDVGEVELVQITSRDPSPPPIDYIKVSGGLFRDMMIHDFDMARFLLGEEIVEVSATGSVLVDKAIGEAGDVDTAVASLRTASGKLAVITCSRRATYGYDQRVEVLGSRGMLSVGNLTDSVITSATASGFCSDPLMDFFMTRYADAYRIELEAFVSSLQQAQAPTPSGTDGLRALLIADAACKSVETGAAVAVGSVD